MKKHFSGPQIVAKLRQADVLLGQGKAVPEVCKDLEISLQTYYRWRQKYGGMSVRLQQKWDKKLFELRDGFGPYSYNFTIKFFSFKY